MTTAVRERPPRRTADIVVGIILAVVALGVAFAFYTEWFTLRDPNGRLVANCTASGARCDQGLLDAIAYIGYAVSLFGWGIPVGIMLARFVQRRRAFFLPIISIAVILVGFYVLLAILGRNYGV